MNNFKIQYLIELECIDEANEFGLKLGEKGYAVAFAASDFTRAINNCNVYDDLDTAVFNARLVYKRGDFRHPSETVRNKGLWRRASRKGNGAGTGRQLDLF